MEKSCVLKFQCIAGTLGADSQRGSSVLPLFEAQRASPLRSIRNHTRQLTLGLLISHFFPVALRENFQWVPLTHSFRGG